MINHCFPPTVHAPGMHSSSTKIVALGTPRRFKINGLYDDLILLIGVSPIA